VINNTAYSKKKTFRASWGGGIWAVSLAVLTFDAVLSVVFLVVAHKEAEVRIPMIVGAIFIAVVTVLPVIWAPMKYSVSDKLIIVERFGPDVIIPLAEVSGVRRLRYREVFHKALRTFGSGGLFGIYGSFRSASMGNFRAYMTRTSSLVVLTTADKPIVLTPDDPPALVTAVEQGMKTRGSQAPQAKEGNGS
jgi:hypothetical protein